MSKALLCLLALVALGLALTDKEIMQQGLNGMFDQNKLSRPTTIVDCFDDQTAHSVVEFGGQILAKAASATVNDYLQIIVMSKKFLADLPPPVQDCLKTNQEIADLGLKYNIDASTDPAAIQKKIASYAVLHYLDVKRQSNVLNNYFIAGKYYELGFEGGAYGHKVLASSRDPLPNLTDKQILQLMNELIGEISLAEAKTQSVEIASLRKMH